MGSQINRILDLEHSWLKECEAQDLRCKACFMYPPYDERDIFMDTGMCRVCHEQSAAKK